jgi:hypothetical protein
MLGFMAMEHFRQSPVLVLPLLALALFMLVFLALAIRTLLTRKQTFEHVANLPLDSHKEHSRD